MQSQPRRPEYYLQVTPDQFLVCGLGSLGQHCVANLKTFGVKVTAIDVQTPANWEIPNLPELLEDLQIGDCRYTDVLEKAGIHKCRAVLLVTSNERVNIEAALSARVLNPKVRLVVRSAKQNLNELLGHRIGNFVAFEPTELSAPAFALAAFSEKILGFFSLGNYQFQVVQRQIDTHHRWCNARTIHEVNNRHRRVLQHIPAAAQHHDFPAAVDSFASTSEQFHTWLPNTKIKAGDLIITMEARADIPSTQRRRSRWGLQPFWLRLQRVRSWPDFKRQVKQIWQSHYEHQIRRVALICGITVAALCATGVVLFRLNYPGLNIVDAFYATVVLLLGGYGDLFSEFNFLVPIPWWLRLFGLGLTLAGTAFIGVLYALLTEQLLTLRFQFLTRRPPVPLKDHVVIIGLGRVGQRIATLLQQLDQAVVGIDVQALESNMLPELPILSGNITHALSKANLARAKSIVAVSEDEMQNLEMGLMAHGVNSNCGLIIRTYDQRFSDKVAQLFQYAHVLCTSALSADAFAAAAFGENVINLFRLGGQTILATEYDIELGDTLNGLLLAEIAYGYGVVPIFYQHRSPASTQLMPSDDIRLEAGDRLVVLATIRGLQRIEQGRLAERRWRIRIERSNTDRAHFDGATELARTAGCSLRQAQDFMHQLPGTFPKSLYRHQAIRLVRHLSRLQIPAKVIRQAAKRK